MKRAILLIVLVALALPIAGQSYDRRPVTLSGMYPDQWGASLGNGMEQVRRNHYPDADRIYCTGIIIAGYRPDSSWLRGTARYWDKMLCAVKLNSWSDRGVVFVLDPKKTRWVIYRKRDFNFS